MTTEQTVNNVPHLLRALSDQMADAVAAISPALLLVSGRQRQPATGIAYAPNLVLTASHVVEREENIAIQTPDKQTLAARLVGRDRATDLALLRVDELTLAPAAFAQEQTRVGQLVLAVGRDPNAGPMTSVGIVSVAGGPLRTASGALLERYLRTDAIPYPGFSGGPLIDVQGHVVGILTSGLVEGIPLAVPGDIARRVADVLATDGSIKRGYLGISSQLIELPPAQRAGREQEHALLIVKVDEGSPAQKGGIIVGDILVGLDGHILKDAEDLQVLLSSERVEKAVPVEVIRGTTLETLQVTVGQRS